MNKDQKTRNKKILWIVLGAVWFIIIALNLISWLSSDFSTWYTEHITMIWVNTYSRITGILPFSVGEIMLTLGIILTAAIIIISICLIFLRKRSGFKTFARRYYKTYVSIFTAICLLMTLNCTILYHARFIVPNPQKASRQYTVSELRLLRNHIVEQCNEYSELMERDAEGYVIYSKDMQKEAKDAMHNISDIYPKLSGFYPDVKTMMYSSLMCQMYMAGYYFPFSLEANSNGYMYIVNVPETYCHELSHLHGYIYEDEANFIAFLACVNSDDDFFRYSGYMSVLNYVYNAYWNYIEDWDAYADEPQTNDLVDKDNIFLTEDTWHRVEENAVLDTETVDEISDSFTDATLKVNGVSDGMASYSRVVGLLLEYYDGILY